MRNKNKGSSLITVVIIFSILITVGTALVSMTVGDYKMRTKESKRIENLYGSDSGLDVAYDIMVKTFDEAVKFGEFNARKLKIKAEKYSDESGLGPNVDSYKEAKNVLKRAISDIDKEHAKNHKNGTEKCSCKKEKNEAQEKFDEEVERLMEAEFQRCFKVFIKKDSDEVGSKEYIPDNVLGESICNHYYRNMKLEEENVGKDVVEKEDFSRINEVKFNEENSKPELFVCNNDKIDELKKITENDSEFTSIKNDFDGISYYSDNDNKGFHINVTSRFIDKGKNDNDVTKNNLRVLQTTYNIMVPDYKDIAFSDSTKKVQSNVSLNDKVMVVGRNMTVNQQNKIAIDGDIFVWGDTPKITNKVYDKYQGGINLKSCDIDFNGEVVTEKTFNIENDVKSNIYGNLYARNVYIGNLKGTPSENSSLTVKESKKENNKVNSEERGQVVIDNDITLKSKNTQVSIDNFYGINDKNIRYGECFHQSTEGTNERTSSSIIINGDEKSNIKINNKAYIMGVAHIDTDPEYQTGESTGVKGNYIAYATPLNNEENLKYYNPLQLLDEENISNKSKHFVDYWKDKLSDIKTGGIQLPNETYSVGAIVYKDKSGKIQVKDSNYRLDIDNKIKEKRLEYASKVYEMGKKLEKDLGERLYNTLGKPGKSDNPVNNLMELNNIPKDYDLESQKLNNEKAIFNKYSNKTIIIRGKNASSIYYNYESNVIADEEKIVLDADNREFNAFIAADGDVIIDGEVNFNGNIITKGNLIIQGNQEKNIKYDKELCDRIKASNDKLFYSVFGDYSDDENIDDDEPSLSNKDEIVVQYDLNKFIKTNIWRIIR
ncbi:hypothetical protein FDB64_13010 [Clostridium botulinum]|uniref:hypothetical protein n=1 Tax=Clostridium botulinum TaxID=1491 RepID=UPI0013F04A88|nr:hypothetical protein [Clostridium botulinum]MBY6914937.1 hypothetical protein [Clostridium botulinum]NFL35977.1 hypothetical protein [Clostridium botulinum]NFM04345.1 hypothetical protein [Clostridium botulinum]NFO38755.1 hypothetical protein [Clostridium botulinum]NFQ39939.1 hypothetical protein [Clostridium botulinum]